MIDQHRPLGSFTRSGKRMLVLKKKPENIYVAASLHNRARTTRFALKLQDAGFVVTSRWIRDDFSDKPNEDEEFSKFADFENKWGQYDLEDLQKADTLIVFGDVASSSGGFHVELGYFLGASRENIIVVGDRPNVFYFTNSIRFTPDESDLITWLKSQDHGSLSK